MSIKGGIDKILWNGEGCEKVGGHEKGGRVGNFWNFWNYFKK